MNKKTKLYLLIAINLIAWGYVGYKVYKALQGDENLELGKVNVYYNKIESNEKSDTVTLLLNYDDPFLKNSNFVKEQKNTQILLHKKPKLNENLMAKNSLVNSKSEVTITYIGLLKNNDNGTKTVILRVNGKTLFAKEKDNIEGYIVKKITNQAVELIKGNERRTITK